MKETPGLYGADGAHNLHTPITGTQIYYFFFSNGELKNTGVEISQRGPVLGLLLVGWLK